MHQPRIRQEGEVIVRSTSYAQADEPEETLGRGLGCICAEPIQTYDIREK